MSKPPTEIQLPDHWRFSKTDPRFVEAERSRWLGMYQSGFRILAVAAGSNYRIAVQSTSEIVKFHRELLEKHIPRPLRFCLVNAKYDDLLWGPLLGSVVLTVNSIEAFLRLHFRVQIEAKRPREARAKGADQEIKLRMRDFDDLPLVTSSGQNKLGETYRIVMDKPPPKRVQRELGKLVRFRNEVTHSDPVVRVDSGEDEVVRRGRAKQVTEHDKRDDMEYPIFWSGGWPVTLHHVAKAARIHDAILRDILGASKARFLHHPIQGGFGDLQFHGIEKRPGVDSDEPERISAAWDEVKSDYRSMTSQELHALSVAVDELVKSGELKLD